MSLSIPYSQTHQLLLQVFSQGKLNYLHLLIFIISAEKLPSSSLFAQTQVGGANTPSLFGGSSTISPFS